jgi:hypothetical protein
VSQDGKRVDSEVYRPNYRDIIHSQGLIDLYLLSLGYRMGTGTLRVQPQGFGHGAPYSHTPFSAKGVLIDTCVYFCHETDSSTLELSFVAAPKLLMGLVKEIIRNTPLPSKRWNSLDFGLIEVSSEFPRYPNKVCVRDIIERIKGSNKPEFSNPDLLNR